MNIKNCCLCLEKVNGDEADVLVMGPYGSPRCLCEECSSLLNTAATDMDYDKIVGAMDSLADKMSKRNIDDKLTVATMTDLLASYAKRAKAIKNGEELPEEVLDEGFEEVPEELRELEEDRELDEKEEERATKINRVIDWICAAVIVAAAAFAVYRIFFT